MQFRTEIQPLEGYRGTIVHGDPILLLGSCFSDNIGRLLADDLFDVSVNPFGPLYNPVSILHVLRMVENGTGDDRFCTSDGCYLTYDAHSRISARTPDDLRQKMVSTVGQTRSLIEGGADVIITLGTTRLFSLVADGKPVANCHKQPGYLFTERMLCLGETVDTLEEIVTIVRRLNPEARLILTVSPLRYPGRDPHANTISKSVLHLAEDEIVRRHEELTYFPAFEIMTDDLRDYRFYADDMRHPSEKGVAYIYEKFSQSFFSEPTMELARQARRLTRRLQHRTDSPRDIDSWPEMSVVRSNPQINDAFQRYLSSCSLTPIR